jgi:hypothetical protein
MTALHQPTHVGRRTTKARTEEGGAGFGKVWSRVHLVAGSSVLR